MLVRHRHGRTVFAAALQELPYPLAASIRLAPHPADRRPRTMHQELAERGIAALADAEQALLPAGGMLARHQAQPGGKLPTVLERARVTDRGHEGGRC